MAAEDNLSIQFNKPASKRKRTMAYSYEDPGVTFCTSCHKQALQSPQRYGIEGKTPTVKHNTDYEMGDLEVCSGGCGKTIYGRKGSYDG